jgi:hypothetical protein
VGTGAIVGVARLVRAEMSRRSSGVADGGRKGEEKPRGAGAGARGRRRVRDAEETVERSSAR